MVVLRRELPGEVDDHRLVFARREADVGNYRAPPSIRIAHLERRRGNRERLLLRECDVDARVGGIDPAAQKKVGAWLAGILAQIEDEIMRFDDALITRRREIRDVNIIALP